MILPVLLNAWYRYFALKECDIILFKLENEDNSTKGQPKVETQKKLELCKSNLSAQAANHAWNKLNNLINDKVKSLNLEGKVDRDRCIIVALHYLRAKKVPDVTLKKLKPLLKRYCVPCMKDSAKDDLLRSLN